MAKYTFENLIIDPETPGLESLIGKEVYYDNVPVNCISFANNDFSVGILKGISKGESSPFQVMTSTGCILDYICIIPKKEKSKPEVIPFKNVADFLNAYSYIDTKNFDEDCYPDTPGIWLKYRSPKVDVDVYGMVTDFWDNGLAIHNKLNTDGTVAFNDNVSWDELCKDYTFLDGTPCGKLKDESNE